MNHGYIALRLEASRSGDFQSPCLKMGDFKSPLLGLRHPRTKNNALRFQTPRDDNAGVARERELTD